LVNPNQKERFYLRLLLLHVKGATSYENLRTVNTIVYQTYFDAAKALNLSHVEQEWDDCLKEASQFQFPTAMCELFAFICVSHNPMNSLQLFKKYKTYFYHQKLSQENGEIDALTKIESFLDVYGYKLDDFNLPSINQNIINKNVSFEDSNYNDISTLEDISKYFENIYNINTLTEEQKNIFDAVISAVNGNSIKKYINIDGPGGSGKSYLLNTITHQLQNDKKKVLSVAWTGIAANLLIDGKTVHTALKLPFNILGDTTCNEKTKHKNLVRFEINRLNCMGRNIYDIEVRI